MTFQVKQAWKGVAGEQITVVTVPSEAACGYEFRVETAYLVYARMSPDLELSVPMTGLCDRTKPLREAQEEITFLNRATATSVAQSSWGRLKAWGSMQAQSLRSGSASLRE